MSFPLSTNNSVYDEAVKELNGNQGQLAAFMSTGNAVVLAGPGSGKTKALTVKMAKILYEDVKPPRKVACITYNNQCVRELSRRLNKLGIEDGNCTFIGTVHLFCLTQVVIPYAKLAGFDLPEKFEIASISKQNELLNIAIKKVAPDVNPQYIQTALSDYRKTHIFRNLKEWTEDEYFRPMVEIYEKSLIDNGLIDFDGMVLAAMELINNHSWVRKAMKAKFPVLMIDEYQDLGVPLHQIVLKLCIEGGVRLFAVGDPDQSIYGFNGARPNLLRELVGFDQYLNKFELALNYRCGSNITEASKALLDYDATYTSVTEHDSYIFKYICPQGFQEQLTKIFNEIIPQICSTGIQIGKIGILYPNMNDGQQIADKAAKAGLGYIRFDNGSPYRRTRLTAWLEDCAAWCAGGWEAGDPKLSKLINTWLHFNPSLTTEAQVLPYKRRLIKFLFNNREGTMKLDMWLRSAFNDGLFNNLQGESLFSDDYIALSELLQAVSEGNVYESFTVESFKDQSGSDCLLNLSSMHSAKGLEYDAVIIPGLEEGKMPWTYNATEAQIQESRRLFYVSLTRAKKQLHLLWSGFTVNQFGRIFNNGRSRFINEMEQKMDGCKMLSNIGSERKP